MKKLPVIFLLLALFLTGCGAKLGTTDEAVLEIIDPGKYTEEEIYAAMDAAMAEFRSGFLDCRMTSIVYDGKARAKAEAYEAEVYGTDRVMILLSDFETGPKSMDAAFDQNITYKNWQWIVVEDGEGSWTVRNYGYG